MASKTTVLNPDQADYSMVAPIWHTAIVLLVLAVFFVWSGYSRSFSPIARSHGRMAGYVAALATEWLLTGLVWWGIRLRGFRLRDLVGGNWSNWKRITTDVLVACGFLILSNIALGIVSYVLKVGKNPAVRELVPHGRSQVLVYLLLSLTAGICEEIICRGYLQRQFTALTRNVAVGCLIQAFIFGIGHIYQGVKIVPVLVLYGLFFGVLAQKRRSLRPGMIAHFMHDGILGLIVSHFLK